MTLCIQFFDNSNSLLSMSISMRKSWGWHQMLNWPIHHEFGEFFRHKISSIVSDEFVRRSYITEDVLGSFNYTDDVKFNNFLSNIQHEKEINYQMLIAMYFCDITAIDLTQSSCINLKFRNIWRHVLVLPTWFTFSTNLLNILIPFGPIN